MTTTTTKKLRSTKQRDAIKKAFEEADRPLGPQEVLEIAGKMVNKLGIATVYRNIKTMLEQNELEAVELPGQPSRYDLPRKKEANTSLLMCEKTNRVFYGNADLKIDLPKIPGFNVKNYQVIIYGESQESK